MKRHEKERVIYELVDQATETKALLKRLVDAGIALDDISLMVREDIHDRDFTDFANTRMRDGIAAGGLFGGVLGGVVGGVLAVGTALTGVGLVVVGPMLALGAAGGLVGGLASHGIADDEAHRLRDALHKGQSLIAVHVHRPADIEAAMRVFAEFKGERLDQG